MLRELGAATHLSRDDVDEWSKAKASDLYLGDVVDHANAYAMSVGFAYYEPGAANEWVVTYDEAHVVTYPHWVDAQERSDHSGLLDTFEPFDGTPPV